MEILLSNTNVEKSSVIELMLSTSVVRSSRYTPRRKCVALECNLSPDSLTSFNIESYQPMSNSHQMLKTVQQHSHLCIWLTFARSLWCSSSLSDILLWYKYLRIVPLWRVHHLINVHWWLSAFIVFHIAAEARMLHFNGNCCFERFGWSGDAHLKDG